MIRFQKKGREEHMDENIFQQEMCGDRAYGPKKFPAMMISNPIRYFKIKEA